MVRPEKGKDTPLKSVTRDLLKFTDWNSLNADNHNAIFMVAFKGRRRKKRVVEGRSSSDSFDFQPAKRPA